eukprot:1158202-Pelagomonas_calceolata.AAC.3
MASCRPTTISEGKLLSNCSLGGRAAAYHSLGRQAAAALHSLERHAAASSLTYKAKHYFITTIEGKVLHHSLGRQAAAALHSLERRAAASSLTWKVNDYLPQPLKANYFITRLEGKLLQPCTH